MDVRAPMRLVCLVAAALWLAPACSTPATSAGAGQADAGDPDADFLIFDAKTEKIDAGAKDVPKPDVPDVPAAHDADAADSADSAVDAAAGPDGTPGTDGLGDDAVDDGDAATAEDADADDAAAAADGGAPTPFAHLCDPCTATAACNDDGSSGNVCVNTGGDGSFCGVACDPGNAASCPDNYGCQTTTDPVLGAVTLCRPVSGTCTCSVTAALAGLSTACSVTNALGTCSGTRTCGVSGLGKCTAPAATEEICNGLDDNCDGQTDEGLCIGNVCLGGQCDPSTGVCAPAAAGTSCDDKNNCTTADGCSFGTCVGTTASDGNDTAPGTAIANKTDCNGTSAMQSILAPASDVDWFTFNASDKILCSIYPSARIDQMAGDYDLCVYWACKDGSSNSGVVGCDQGQKVSNGPNGMWGCCSQAAGLGAEKVEINTTCSTLGLGDDGGAAWIKVTAHDPKAANICGGYTLTWSAASF